MVAFPAGKWIPAFRKSETAALWTLFVVTRDGKSLLRLSKAR